MPYETIYVPAELFMEHNGVKLYYTYKDNDVQNGTRTYWYDNIENSDDEGTTAVDVRELHEQMKSAHSYEIEEGRIAILRDAIDAGLVEAGNDEDGAENDNVDELIDEAEEIADRANAVKHGNL